MYERAATAIAQRACQWLGRSVKSAVAPATSKHRRDRATGRPLAAPLVGPVRFVSRPLHVDSEQLTLGGTAKRARCQGTGDAAAAAKPPGQEPNSPLRPASGLLRAKWRPVAGAPAGRPSHTPSALLGVVLMNMGCLARAGTGMGGSRRNPRLMRRRGIAVARAG